MKTAATNKKVRELISLVREGKLIPRPEFQRRLVWTQKDKDRFLDTVLNGLPFPEIYLADGDVDLETGQGTQQLVDGLQRVTTLIQYFEGDGSLKLRSVPNYHELEDNQKKEFLQYDVAVRDLGAITREMIVEVFQRINATKYSLNDIEINNAVYNGALKRFANEVGEREFFGAHRIFSASDYKRMGDLRFALGVVCTYLRGYFNRDDLFDDMLARYNDEFPHAAEVSDRLDFVMGFIDECGFPESSRVWKKADIFTLLVELDRIFREPSANPQPSFVVETLTSFYADLSDIDPGEATIATTYYKAALQASNDRVNRVRRGIVIGGLLEGLPEADIAAELRDAGKGA